MVFQRDPGSQALDYAPEQHYKTHGLGGGDQLSLDDLVEAPANGSILVAQSIGPGRYGYREYALSVPAANVRNALAVDNGETRPTWKTTLDGTNPATLTVPNTGGPGTSLVYSHRDHSHPVSAHDLLSTANQDTTPASVVRGDIITGQGATPKWARLAKPATPAVMYNDATDAAWDTMAWTGITSASGNFGSDVGTFTVADADIVDFSYRLMGKTMWIQFYIVTASQTVTAANYLTIKLPVSKTANRTQFGHIKAVVGGVPLANTLVFSVAGTTTLRIYVDFITAVGGAGGTWGPVPLTDNIYLAGGITLETT